MEDGGSADVKPRKRARKGSKPATTEQAEAGPGPSSLAASVSGAENGPPKPRRKRITPEQLRILTAGFEISDTPSFTARERLAAETGMTNREVQIWHQNRRQKRARAAARQTQLGESTAPEDILESGLPARPDSSRSVDSTSTSTFEPSVLAESPVVDFGMSLSRPSSGDHVRNLQSPVSYGLPQPIMQAHVLPPSTGLALEGRVRPAFTLPPISTLSYPRPRPERTRSAPAAESENTSYFASRPDLPKPATNHLGLFDEAGARLPMPTPPLPPRRPTSLAEEDETSRMDYVGMPQAPSTRDEWGQGG